jgi:tetratricopeptide (TPR) repeat protein
VVASPSSHVSPEELHERARDLLLRGDTAGAIADLKEYLEAEPDDEQALLELGTAYAAIHHVPQALTALARAVELDPTVAAARLAYARALVAARKLDDAAFQLIQANRLDPADARVMKELGIVFYDKRLYDKAARWLAQALAAAPTDARIAFSLGLAEEARKDLGAAIAAYRLAVRLDPGHVDARKTLADALAMIGEHEQAIAELDALLAPGAKGGDQRLRDQTNEVAARNREVLTRVLADMRARRLLGKTARELEGSALVQQGQLKRKGRVPSEGFEAAAELSGVTEVVRWLAPMVELYAVHGAAGVIEALWLVLTHPERAAAATDEAFKVTVVGEDGTTTPVNLATAFSITFLREALASPKSTADAPARRALGSPP